MRGVGTKFLAFIVVSLAVLFSGTKAGALDASQAPVDYYSPVFITAFQASAGLDAVELYNSEDSPVDLSLWKVVAGDDLGEICEISLSDYVIGGSYVALAKNGTIDDQTGNVRTYDDCSQPGRTVTKIILYLDGDQQDSLNSFTPGVYFRKGTTKTYRTGVFTKDFVTIASSSSRQSFYADPWYAPPMVAPLRITEIVAHAKTCSPLDNSAGCYDYIKIYNPTIQSVDLGLYRLRSGYNGQTATSSNTFPLSGILASGHYAIIQSEGDGSPLNLTNSGGWIWFEDSQGIRRYDESVTEYADAGSSTKIGWVWAYDDAAAKWQWTIEPTPYDEPSHFVLPSPEAATTANSTLKPCAPNQYRSSETHRCRLISSGNSALASCAPNQYRSPETNRCRLITSSASTLAPCAPGKFRNPLTNRCKSASTTTASLKPCTSGQERNPTTNRCRKVQSSIVPVADFAVRQIKDSGKATLGWWAFGGVGIVAAGYGAWEWREEVSTIIRKVGTFFTSSK